MNAIAAQQLSADQIISYIGLPRERGIGHVFAVALCVLAATHHRNYH
jgi:hypothetical protein